MRKGERQIHFAVKTLKGGAYNLTACGGWRTLRADASGRPDDVTCANCRRFVARRYRSGFQESSPGCAHTSDGTWCEVCIAL
jgi:hypothetical protein